MPLDPLSRDYSKLAKAIFVICIVYQVFTEMSASAIRNIMHILTCLFFCRSLGDPKRLCGC